ncbi:hypothetical protein [Natronorubrum texcoconense]|uniref:Uncharacterized protein n=1 Tax=Natronorubrum texcoconense TaxID=1095776 RepID=A0A1G8WSP0_9EURY|nr:hypothetical protein [Natronorubrum texcoconense]SDJ80610.1 hypothetical protein SAMN04515672_1476 [Natronorubrum texcoconense]
MTGDNRNETVAEASAREQIPSETEGMTLGEEPVLCPHVCGAYVGAGFAAGAAAGCYTERCIDGNPEPLKDIDEKVEDDASIDDIVETVQAAD